VSSAAGRSGVRRRLQPKLEVAGVRWELAPGLDAPRWRDRLALAIALAEGGQVRNEKSGRRKELYSLCLDSEAPGAERDHLLKVNRYQRLDGWRRRWAGSKARRELQRALRVEALGVATPAPCAAGERIEQGRLTACYLLVPAVRDAHDLREVWRAGIHGAERRAMAHRFGAFVRAAHDAGIRQDDLAPNNFLVEPDGTLQMIDFERARLQGEVPRGERQRALAKLDRELAGARLGDRARFLSGYAGGPGGEWRRLWRELESEVGRLARRDARRLVRVTSRPGRRFREVRHADWRGRRRAEIDAPLLAAALDGLLRAAPAPAGPDLAFRTAQDWWALEQTGATRSEAERSLAMAELLARRRLGPRPVAGLSRPGHSLLVFEGCLPPRIAESIDPAALLPSLTVLLDRLLSLGRLDGLDARGLAVDPSCARTASGLLAACCLHADAPHADGRHGRARAEARRLLGLPG
jgi:hypothetical protein